MPAVLTYPEITSQRLDSMAGLRGFELPEDDSSNTHQLTGKGTHNVSGLHTVSAGISVRWTKRHLEVRILSAQPARPQAALATNMVRCWQARTVSPLLPCRGHTARRLREPLASRETAVPTYPKSA